MSATPSNKAGSVTEDIMSCIREHLKETVNFGTPPNIHHYNRVYEHIYRILVGRYGEK